MKTAIALLLLVALPGFSTADVLYDDAIAFGPSYASGPPAGFPWDPVVYVGAPLSIFGIVNNVGALFTDLLPPGSYEMTCVFEGATCDQWDAWDDFVCTGGICGSFDGGTMSIYLDTTPDADFMNPASFRNGELVLQAQTQTTFATDDDPNVGCPMVADRPDVQTWFTFSGGSWFYRVSSGGVGMMGVGEGEVHDAFQAGTLSIYVDTTPDADFTNPATLRDGELVLLAQLSATLVADDDPGAACPWMDDIADVKSDFTFTGGAWFSRVNGAGILGFSHGEINYPGNVPAPLQALGYTLRIDGTMDICGPVAVQPTTWGHVKLLYR